MLTIGGGRRLLQTLYGIYTASGLSTNFFLDCSHKFIMKPIVANHPGFAGILPVFLAFPGSRPVYLVAIEFPGKPTKNC